MIGIDEAGLGPVLGSMFVGGIKVEDKNKLSKEIKDSKKLSNEEIYELADELYDLDNIHVCVIEVPPKNFENDKKLNDITKETHAKVIDSISESGDDVYIDACDTSIDRFKRDIKRKISKDININAEHKADEKYKIVGAASIVAKYAREQQISELSGEYGNIGSGYPSDKKTVDFLEDYYQKEGSFPWFARETWKTCQRLKQGTLKDFS